ncbi:MAG: transcriptional regulator [Rhodobacteraceae bacterium]|nr:transcriptional regulator [Paracoccaceae bacterium]
MMEKVQQVSQLLRDLRAMESCQYAIGVRIRFANPTLVYHSYPMAWIEEYDRLGLRFQDPTVRWGMTTTGIIRWSELVAQDAAGVFTRAADHGLRYGLGVSVGAPESRTLGFFARSDRELDASETAQASRLITGLHETTEGLELESQQTLHALRILNDTASA